MTIMTPLQNTFMAYMDAYGSISCLYAKQRFGIDDLSAFVDELCKQQGLRISPCFHGQRLVGFRYLDASFRWCL